VSSGSCSNWDTGRSNRHVLQIPLQGSKSSGTEEREDVKPSDRCRVSTDEGSGRRADHAIGLWHTFPSHWTDGFRRGGKPPTGFPSNTASTAKRRFPCVPSALPNLSVVLVVVPESGTSLEPVGTRTLSRNRGILDWIVVRCFLGGWKRKGPCSGNPGTAGSVWRVYP
jgi:hypothetical protein